jgi:hypothetical protein
VAVGQGVVSCAIYAANVQALNTGLIETKLRCEDLLGKILVPGKLPSVQDLKLIARLSASASERQVPRFVVWSSTCVLQIRNSRG